MDNKTGYDWCLESNLRILDLADYDLPSKCGGWYYEEDYYTIPVSKEDFLEAIKDCSIKPNSTPRKTASYLEYRLYGLVPYNISSIQGAIQYGHALQEYNNMHLDAADSMLVTPLNYVGFDKWRKGDKTFIILNGGTTNEDRADKFYGSMQQNRDILIDNGIRFAEFKEPDLNNSLTAVVFLVDERVFDKELYKKFEPETIPWSKSKPTEKQLSELEVRNAKNYLAWEEKIGGPKNSFLREFLKNFKLAN